MSNSIRIGECVYQDGKYTIKVFPYPDTFPKDYFIAYGKNEMKAWEDVNKTLTRLEGYAVARLHKAEKRRIIKQQAKLDKIYRQALKKKKST